MRDVSNVDPEVIELIGDLRFRDKRGMSVEVFDDQPWEEIWLARTVWSADVKRANLEEERQRPI